MVNRSIGFSGYMILVSKCILLLFCLQLFSLDVTAQLLLPGKDLPKPAETKPAPKSTPKPVGKPAAAKPPVKSSPAAKPASEPVQVEEPIVTFASFEDLKNFKNSGQLSRWKPERRILLYNLYRDKKVNNVQQLKTEISKTLSSSNLLLDAWKQTNEKWNGEYLYNQEFKKTASLQDLIGTKNSLVGMNATDSSLKAELEKHKTGFQALGFANEVREYYKEMFINSPQGSEEAEIKNVEAMMENIRTDITNLSIVASSLGTIVKHLDEGMVELEKTIASRPAIPTPKKNEDVRSSFLNSSNSMGSLLVQKAAPPVITTSNEGGTIYTFGITMAKMLKHEYAQTFRNSDMAAIKAIFKGNVSAPMEVLGGHTPLVFACVLNSNSEVLRYLIESGADLNATTFNYGAKIPQSPLFLYCVYRNFKDPETLLFIEYMLKKGARPYMSTDPSKRRNEAAMLRSIWQLKKDNIRIMKTFGIDLQQDAGGGIMGMF